MRSQQYSAVMDESRLLNCSIALTAEERTPPKQTQSRIFFLLHNPDYDLIRDALTTRRRGASQRRSMFFGCVEKRDSGAILLRKTNLMR